MDLEHTPDLTLRRCAGDLGESTCWNAPTAMVTVAMLRPENGSTPDHGTFFCSTHLDMLPIEGLACVLPSGSIVVTAA